MSSYTYIGQVSTDNSLRLNNVFPIKHNVLRSTKNWMATHSISRGLSTERDILNRVFKVDMCILLTVSIYSALLKGISGSSIMNASCQTKPFGTPNCTVMFINSRTGPTMEMCFKVIKRFFVASLSKTRRTTTQLNLQDEEDHRRIFFWKNLCLHKADD